MRRRNKKRKKARAKELYVRRFGTILHRSPTTITVFFETYKRLLERQASCLGCRNQRREARAARRSETKGTRRRSRSDGRKHRSPRRCPCAANNPHMVEGRGRHKPDNVSCGVTRPPRHRIFPVENENDDSANASTSTRCTSIIDHLLRSSSIRFARTR
jgi:hypothetical protein